MDAMEIDEADAGSRGFGGRPLVTAAPPVSCPGGPGAGR
jgi:hypothetical protein